MNNSCLKNVSLITVCFLLVGCANAIPSIPELVARQKWQGKNIREAIAKWGVPSQIVKGKDGLNTAYWGSSSNAVVREVVGQTAVAAPVPGGFVTSPVIQDSVVNYSCRLEITFNEDNIITRFNTTQNRLGGCEDLWWGDNSP